VASGPHPQHLALGELHGKHMIFEMELNSTNPKVLRASLTVSLKLILKSLVLARL
jgi:hypothetical protein